jgi:TRAP-type mannitol/chloroaromatic compound transport system substrate-binding protein
MKNLDKKEMRSIAGGSMANQQRMHETNMWKQVNDTQTKVYEIQQEVILNRVKTTNKVFNNW